MSDEKNGFFKACSKFKKARYVVLTILIVFVIVAVFSYREDLTVENFRYLMKYVDIKPLTFGSSESAQINFESDSSTVTASFKEDLVAVSKTAVRIYDLSSKEILSSSHSITNPAISTGGKYFAVYDIGGKYLAIYNSFSKVWETTLEYPIYDVQLDSKGNFSVVTASKGYPSALKVFSQNFENIFNWRSSDKYAVSSDIITDKEIYTLTATVRGNERGDMVSSLIALSSTSSDPLFALDFEGEMAMECAFFGNDKIAFLTDKALRITDRSGKVLNEYKFKSKSLRKFRAGEEFCAVVINENLVGKDHKAIIFDADGNTFFEVSVRSEITDLAISDEFLFLLGVEDVTVVGLENKSVKSYPSERSYRSVELFDDETVWLVYDGLAVAVKNG